MFIVSDVMSVRKKYLKELEVLSGVADPLAKKTPQELCSIALDEVSPNRLSAIKRLGNYSGLGVTQVLMLLTGESHSFDVRLQALEALSKSNDERVARRFGKLLEDKDVEIRRSIVRIAQSASEQVKTVVSIYALDDEDDSVRELAEQFFWALPDPDPNFDPKV